MPYKRLRIAKGYIDRFMAPPLCRLRKFGVHPIHFTVLSLPSGLLGVFFLYRQPVLAAVFVASYILLDVLDGTMARVTGTVTKTGERLDFIIDRLVAAFFMVSLYFHTGDIWFPGLGLTLIIAVSLEDAGLIKR